MKYIILKSLIDFKNTYKQKSYHKTINEEIILKLWQSETGKTTVYEFKNEVFIKWQSKIGKNKYLNLKVKFS